MTVKITKTKLLAEQTATVKGRAMLWDSELTGVGARVGARSIVFVVRYQHGPVERKMTIGTLAEFGTVEAARRRAAELRLQVRAGHDPLQQLRERRKPATNGVTLGEAIDR